MSAPDSSGAAEGIGQRELSVFISIRTILLVGVAVALAWALSSIGDVLLLDEATAARRARIAAADAAGDQPA